MERLTGRYETGVVHVPQGMMPDALERLAAYEDTGLELEEVAELFAIHRGMEGNEYVILDDELRSILFAKNEGRLVVLLCRVGDTVWDREAEPWKVVSVEWFSRKVTHLHCISPVTGGKHTFSVGKRSVGKTVFLTREEAEAALKGEGNG